MYLVYWWNNCLKKWMCLAYWWKNCLKKNQHFTICTKELYLNYCWKTCLDRTYYKLFVISCWWVSDFKVVCQYCPERSVPRYELLLKNMSVPANVYMYLEYWWNNCFGEKHSTICTKECKGVHGSLMKYLFGQYIVFSYAICSYFFMFDELRWELIVHCVDIGGILYHHFFKLSFHDRSYDITC